MTYKGVSHMAKQYTNITVTGKGTPKFLKDNLSNPNMNVLMDRVLDKLAQRGWQVVQTFSHSSYYANGDEVRERGNSYLAYALTDNLDNFITYSEDSHFDHMNRGQRQIDDFHFDRSIIIGRSIELRQVHRCNGTEQDTSVRIIVSETEFVSHEYDHDYHCEQYNTHEIANEKISFGMGDKAIENRLNRLGL